jgi:hypothetical protein
MKQMFFIGAIVALASCTSNDECCTDIKIMGTQCHDTTFLPDSVAMNNMLHADSLSRLNVDSIANVSDLLDTLAAY